MFIYESTEMRLPVYSVPDHFNRTMMGLLTLEIVSAGLRMLCEKCGVP